MRFQYSLPPFIALCTALMTVSSFAAGFALKEQSARYQGSSYAGAASGTGTDSIFFNPAAAGFVEKPSARLDTSVIMGRTTVRGASSASAVGSASGATGDDDFILPAALPAFSAAIPLNQKTSLGLTINAPFGLKNNYRHDWVGRYHAIDSELETINITPVVAYKPNKYVSFATGPQIQYAHAKLSNAVNQRLLLATAVPGNNFGDAVGTVEGDDWAFGWTAGMLLRMEPETRFGFAYKSQINHTLEGDVTYVDRNALLDASLPNASASASASLPASWNMSVQHDVTDRLTLMGDVSLTEWSSFDELRIGYDSAQQDTVSTMDYKDTIFYAVGAEYKVDNALTVRAGAAYDESPASDLHRTPRIPDSDRYWLSLGGTYRLADNFYMDAAYSHIIGEDGSVDLSGTGENQARGSLSADYEGTFHILSLSGRMTF